MKLLDKFKSAAASLEDRLAEIRRLIAELKRQRNEIESAPPPRDEIISRLCRQIDDAVATQSEQLEGWLRPGAKPDLLRIRGRLESAHVVNGAVIADVVSWGGPLALVLADAMKAGIRARIESMEYEPGLPTAEREAALAEINERLLAAELEEEDIVRQAAAAGLTLHRRPDCSPAAVLRWDPAARTFDEDVLLDIEGRARRARAALSQIGREYVDLRADLRSVEEAVWRTCRRAPRGAHSLADRPAAEARFAVLERGLADVREVMLLERADFYPLGISLDAGIAYQRGRRRLDQLERDREAAELEVERWGALASRLRTFIDENCADPTRPAPDAGRPQTQVMEL